MASVERTATAWITANRQSIACLLLALVAGPVAGCRTSEPPQAQPPVAPIPTARETASAGGATGTSPPEEEPSAVTVDAAWVRERPELTRLFTSGRACSRREVLSRDIDDASTTVHAYEVYSPLLPEEDLRRVFGERARELGFTALDTLNGFGFWDKTKRLSAYLESGRLMLTVRTADAPVKVAGPTATALGFETWPLLTGLTDATWESIQITRFARSSELDLRLSVGAGGRAQIEKWAQAHQLQRSDLGWLRKWQPPPTPRPGIVLDFEADGKLTVLETTGQDLTNDACRPHPSRLPKPAPKGTGREPTDDELMKQMMGN